MATRDEDRIELVNEDPIDFPSPAFRERSSHRLQEYIKTFDVAKRRAKLPFSRPSDPAEGAELSLRSFVRRYSRSFPLHVKVVEGYYCLQQDCEISTGEVYLLHSVTKTKTVVVKDNFGAVKHLPAKPHIQYSFLHCPDGDIEKARVGHVYHTVGDLMALSELPDVVCAIDSFKGPSESSSVEESEILFILKVKRSKHGKGLLTAFSVTHSIKKILSSECRGNFSTNPGSVKLPITEFLVRHATKFPRSAWIFSDASGDARPTLCGDLYKVSQVLSAPSVVASLCVMGGAAPGDHCREIPLKVPITVSYERTFHPDGPIVASVIPLKPNEVTYSSLQSTRCEPRQYSSVHPHRSTVATEPSITVPDDKVYGGEGHDSARYEEGSLLQAIEALLKNAIDSVEHLALQVQELRQQVQDLNSKERPPTKRLGGCQTVAERTTNLSSLSVLQVCQLLDHLQLSQYKSIVQHKKISGDILSKLTEDVLLGELMITTKCHRLKLLQVIRGEISIPIAQISDSLEEGNRCML